jgi:hypothetical protein
MANTQSKEPSRATPWDHSLAAIILTSQVVPHLMTPEFLLLAADDVFRQWRRYIRMWAGSVPPEDRPVDEPITLADFVDRYCVDVERADGCGCGHAGTGDECHADECAACTWFAHITKLACRAGAGHPIRALLNIDGRDEQNPLGRTEP